MYLLNEFGVALGHPAEHKKRSLDATFLEEAENPFSIGANPMFEILFADSPNAMSQCRRVKVVFHVHAEDICSCPGQLCYPISGM
jgi:hypothetical protein